LRVQLKAKEMSIKVGEKKTKPAMHGAGKKK